MPPISLSRGPQYPKRSDNTALLLAEMFGNLGGGEVVSKAADPSIQGPTQGSGEGTSSNTIKFKPAHPILNALSGGQGSALANQQNLEQVLQAQEYARKLATMQKASDIQLAQNQREFYIKDTGRLPEDDIPKWQDWKSSDRFLELSKAQTEQAKTGAELGTQRNIQAKGIETETFPSRKLAAFTRSEGDVQKSITEQLAAQRELERSPNIETYKDLVTQDAVSGFEKAKRLEDITKAQVVHPYGVFYRESGRNIPFPNFMQQQFGDLFGGQSGINVKPKIGDISRPIQERYFDPEYGDYVVRKPSVAIPAPVTAKPTTMLAPSTPFSSLPVNALGGGNLNTQLNTPEDYIKAIKPFMSERQGDIGVPSNLNILSLDELKALYNKLINR